MNSDDHSSPPPESAFSDASPGTRYDLYPWLYDVFVEDSVEGDLEWYIDVCLKFGGPVLELGCGTGRVTVPLAEEGLEVMALDSSIAMLEYAKSYAESAGVSDRIHLVQDRMESFSLPDTYPIVIVPFCTFAHLVTPRQQGACLERVKQHLTEDGRFVMDMKRFDPEDFEDGYREWPYSEFFEHPQEEIEVRRKIKAWHNPDEMRIDYVFQYEERPLDGGEESIRTREKHHSLSTVSDVELLALLKGAGFRLEEVYGDHEETPFSPGDSWCCVIASVSDEPAN